MRSIINIGEILVSAKERYDKKYIPPNSILKP